MALATNATLPKFRYTITATDSNGNSYLAPAVGYKLYFYEAGTSSAITVYQDAALTTPHPSPIVLDSDGSAVVYFDTAAKIDLKTDADVAVDGFPVDGIQPITASSSATISEWQPSGVIGTYVSGSTFTVPGDTTATFLVGRRVRINLGTAYRYGSIVTSTYTTSTAVELLLDSGSIDSSMDGNEVYLHINSNFATLNKVEVWTNKELTSPTITTATFSGTQTGFVGNISGSSSSCTGNSATATLATTATTAGTATTATTAGTCTGNSATASTATRITDIDTDSPSGATSAAVEGMSSTYGIHKVYVWNLSRAGSASTLYFRPRNGGADVGSQVTMFTLGTSTTDITYFTMTFYGNPSGGHTKKVHVHGYDSNAGSVLDAVYSTAYTGAIDGFRFYTTGTGPFTGEFRLQPVA